MHTIWWHVIRLIMAAHFHVAPHAVADIQWYGPTNESDDAIASWHYSDRDCSYRTWWAYDVCIIKR